MNQISNEFFPINVRIICDKFIGLDQNFSIVNSFEKDKLKNTEQLIDFNIEKLINDALKEEQYNCSEELRDTVETKIESTSDNRNNNIETEKLIKKATPKKMNRKEKKLKKESENCENIKIMLENMRNHQTANKENKESILNNSNSTHFTTNLKEKDITNPFEIEKNCVNRKIKFLKDFEKSEVKEDNGEVNKLDDDYKFIIDMKEFF